MPQNNRIFLPCLIFNTLKITQQEFEQLAELLLKFTLAYATSKFKVGKVRSPIHLPLKFDPVFKQQRVKTVPIHLQDKVNRLLEYLEQYKVISPVKKEEQPKVNTLIYHITILAKGESLNFVRDARYLNWPFDESKGYWLIELIWLTKRNRKYSTTADMNSA